MFIALTIGLGLGSRTSIIPDFIYPYLGDYLYAVMMYFIVAFLLPKFNSSKVAIISVAVCYCIEILQLYDAEWINNIRGMRLGALVLGSGFLWSDILSYTFGAATLWLLEVMYTEKKSV